MARGMMRKTKNFVIADRGTHNDAIKTVRGRPMKLIAEQLNRRTLRKGKPSYVYYHEGTRDVYYNHSKTAPYWIPLGYDDTEMEKFYQIFVAPPLTQIEKNWCERNDYSFETSS